MASSDADASESAASPKTSPVPEDLDYYDGLLGKQPGYDKAVKEKKGQNGVTTEYPINLPSYLLLVLATVASIAFTGSIFEVTGSNPEVRNTMGVEQRISILPLLQAWCTVYGDGESKEHVLF